MKPAPGHRVRPAPRTGNIRTVIKAITLIALAVTIAQLLARLFR